MRENVRVPIPGAKPGRGNVGAGPGRGLPPQQLDKGRANLGRLRGDAYCRCAFVRAENAPRERLR
jgi:hypothetical protein